MTYNPGNATTALEDALQSRVATNEQWHLATMDGDQEDTAERLISLGFEIVEKSGLFYKVKPPTGFTKETEGYWTTVKDGEKKVIMQFYKAAPWDTRAFLAFQ